ncbi:MAG TPA: Mrp/NBP35 family ATP-binding protein [Bacillota bacterium]|jgi:Mrp family chromosome partitioning ATPase|nr:Mrp/NBP35 family ATP-binding protein [Bacillota bacterium]
MSEKCDQNCSACSKECSDRKEKQTDFSVKLNAKSSVRKVIGIISGKGGVGKSLVASMLAVLMNRRGHSTAIFDADITGPSIPKAFGIRDKAKSGEQGLLPVESRDGIKIMSINLLLESDTDPVIWRGPLIASTIKRFWADVVWGDVDFMFIDMPPGTGDVALTVFQSLPVDGIIIVTSPQELVSMIVSKAVNMAKKMNIPILGIIENMSYLKCPDCGKEINVFGKSRIEEVAKEHGIPVLGKLPIDPAIATAIDKGLIEDFQGDWLDKTAEILEK